MNNDELRAGLHIFACLILSGDWDATLLTKKAAAVVARYEEEMVDEDAVASDELLEMFANMGNPRA